MRRFGLDRLLRPLADVRPGEALTALLLTANVFLILTAYYLLKVAREPLILLGGGAEVKSYASLGQTILLVFVSSAYGWLASRTSRLALVMGVTIFFVVDLLVFVALGARGWAIGVPFYLWVGIFNIVTIAQFWSFAADTYSNEQGKRLFPIVGIGSSAGAVGGAWLAAPIVAHGTPVTLMLVAAFVILVALGLTIWVHFREGASAHVQEHESIPPGNAFVLVAKDPYLLTFAALALLLNFVTKTGDYVIDRELLATAPAKAHALGLTQVAYIAQFKAHYFGYINMIGVVTQLVIVSRVIKLVGVRATLTIIPALSLLAYGVAVVAPVMVIILVGRVLESSIDYSLSNTVQQTLWLPVSREAKYKGKQVIDAFCRRAGDALSAGAVWVGAHATTSTRSFVAINVVASIAWLVFAAKLGGMYRARGGEEVST